MNKYSRIFVAGHNGMLGSAIVKSLTVSNYNNLVLKSRSEVDLFNGEQVNDLFRKNDIEYVFISAAKVGGIKANMADKYKFLVDNIKIQNNIIESAYKYRVKKICFVGSSCMYPAKCEQPMKEEYLLSGKLEITNEGYALAKIIGMKQIEYLKKEYGLNGITVIPCNLYGSNDCFDENRSHVLQALVKKIVDAYYNKDEHIIAWGDGSPKREMMHVDDCANAIVNAMVKYESDIPLNIGTGVEYSINEFIEIICKCVGYTGKIIYDKSMPNGMMRKCMDVSRMKSLGYEPKIDINEGIDKLIKEYISIRK